MRSIDVEIVGIDPATRLFIVVNESLKLQTLRSRAHLCLETDKPDFIEEVKRCMIKYRAEA